MINLTLSSTNDDDDGKMNGNQPDDDFQRMDDGFRMCMCMCVLEAGGVIKYDS
jgi:hypothetical protein